MHLEHFLKTGAPRSRSLCFFEQFPHTRSPPFSARALSPPGCGGSCFCPSSPFTEATGVNGLAPGPAAPEGGPCAASSAAVPPEPMLVPGSVKFLSFFCHRFSCAHRFYFRSCCLHHCHVCLFRSRCLHACSHRFRSGSQAAACGPSSCVPNASFLERLPCGP
jgi:hypothetical protein